MKKHFELVHGLSNLAALMYVEKQETLLDHLPIYVRVLHLDFSLIPFGWWVLLFLSIFGDQSERIVKSQSIICLNSGFPFCQDWAFDSPGISWCGFDCLYMQFLTNICRFSQTTEPLSRPAHTQCYHFAQAVVHSLHFKECWASPSYIYCSATVYTLDGHSFE